MKRIIPFMAIFLLSACSDTPIASAPKVSRVEPAAGNSGITYEQFRDRAGPNEDGMAVKRFIALDRNNDGHLSANEVGNY